MMNHRGWVLWLFLAIACGGKSRDSGGSSSAAGQSGASAGTGNANAGNAGVCPDGSGSEPSEGAPCPSAGMHCSGYGSLSCPLTAVCSADSKWQIHCPATPLFGPCSCAHPDDARIPDEHRATASECSHTRAASMPTPPAECLMPDGTLMCPGECSRDSDCMDSALGKNGRCLVQGPPPRFGCSYDTCFADSACETGSVCQCRESADSVDGNHCTQPSNCRVDADCGENGYCSPSQAHEWCGTFYACHTPDDECLNDSDCDSDTHCDFDSKAKHWLCTDLCGFAPP